MMMSWLNCDAGLLGSAEDDGYGTRAICELTELFIKPHAEGRKNNDKKKQKKKEALSCSFLFCF